jgi:hypothetical protein
VGRRALAGACGSSRACCHARCHARAIAGCCTWVVQRVAVRWWLHIGWCVLAVVHGLSHVHRRAVMAVVRAVTCGPLHVCRRVCAG